MKVDVEQAARDVPLGPVGRALGLSVVPPVLQKKERAEWYARANRRQGARVVGGMLFLTDRRLIFSPSRFERLVRGRAWHAELGGLESAAVADKRTIEVTRGDGTVERFVIGSPEDSAAIIDRAIRSVS